MSSDLAIKGNNLYVADASNHRIQVLQSILITTFLLNLFLVKEA